MDSSSVKGKRAIVIQKQVLPIGNNWRNTEICHRSGSVSHTDARGSLRRISWGKEFTPYALNLNIRFISPGLYKTKQSKLLHCVQNLQAYRVSFRPDSHGTLSVRAESCLPPAFLPGFQGDLLVPSRAFSSGATVSETTQSGPPQSLALPLWNEHYKYFGFLSSHIHTRISCEIGIIANIPLWNLFSLKNIFMFHV